MSVWVRTYGARMAQAPRASTNALPLSGDEISLFVTSTVQCQLDEHFVYLFSKDLTDFKKLSAT